MTPLDVGLCVVVALSAALGLYRGLVRELLALAVWVVAFVAAVLLAEDVAQTLLTGVEGRTVRYASGFTIVFVATIVAGAIVQWLVGRIVATSGLGGVDRLLGLLFGGARGIVAVLVALVALRPFVAGMDAWQESQLVPVLLRFEQDALAFVAVVAGFVSELASGR
jgi:membrane protein required for colicin V production